jgi:drug/metabolite transporter (DMT)-like permease
MKGPVPDTPLPRRLAGNQASTLAGASVARASERVRGIVYMVLGCALLTLNDAAAKWLTDSYPVGEIIFFRGVFALLLILSAVPLHGGMASLKPKDLKGQLSRAALFAMATFLFIYSLKLMALPVVTAISFASPIIMTALAPLLLKEQVGWRRWTAVCVGFAGVLLILNPGGEEWRWAAVVPLGCALAAALRDIVTRQLTARESTPSILFTTAALAAGIGLCTLPLGGWRWPSAFDLALFAFLGVSQAAAHYLQVEAFRMTEAAVLAPFKYSAIIWSLLLGFMIWGHRPSLSMLAGAAIVVASGLYIFQRELRQRACPPA